MDIDNLITSLEASPESWPLRMEVIEGLVRLGEMDRAKAFVRSAPDDVPMPPEYPQWIHTLLTGGPEIFESVEPEEPEPEPEPPVSDSQGDVPTLEGLAEPKLEAVETAPCLLPKREFIPPAELNVSQGSGKAATLELVDRDEFERRPILVPTGEKIGAVAIAIMAHLVVGVVFLYTKLVEPAINPPVISVSFASSSDESSLDNKTMNRSVDQAAATAMASIPALQTKSFSDFAIPDTFNTISDFPMMSLAEIGDGFGMGAVGAGDVAFRGNIPPIMRSRCSLAERIHRMHSSGGDTRGEAAVVRGLDYLVSQQNNETGQLGRSYPVAMTGLSLLAFLGHCETPESPTYGDSVVKAALFLIEKSIKNKGFMATGTSGNHQVYEHAIATYALSEMYTMVKAGGKTIPKLEPVLKKAAEKIIADQSSLGGWGYKKGQADDMSVSGWNIQALKALYNTGLNLSGVAASLDRAVSRYLPEIQDGQGAFRYRPGTGAGKKSLTGAALLGMQIWGR